MKNSAYRVLVIASGAWALGAFALGGCRQQAPTVPPPRDDFARNSPRQNSRPNVQRPNAQRPNANNGGTRLPNGGLPDGNQMRGEFDMSAPILPDSRITPGDTLDVTAADIAVSGYSKKVRNVPSSIKQKAYLNYGIASRQKGEYEVDHLISLQLGGSNSIRNLWPQSFQTQPWNAYIKDALENKLHDLVVSGQMDLPSAQKMISNNWIRAYQQIFKTQLPLKKHMRDASGRNLYQDSDN